MSVENEQLVQETFPGRSNRRNRRWARKYGKIEKDENGQEKILVTIPPRSSSTPGFQPPKLQS